MALNFISRQEQIKQVLQSLRGFCGSSVPDTETGNSYRLSKNEIGCLLEILDVMSSEVRSAVSDLKVQYDGDEDNGLSEGEELAYIAACLVAGEEPKLQWT